MTYNVPFGGHCILPIISHTDTHAFKALNRYWLSAVLNDNGLYCTIQYWMLWTLMKCSFHSERHCSVLSSSRPMWNLYQFINYWNHFRLQTQQKKSGCVQVEITEFSLEPLTKQKATESLCASDLITWTQYDSWMLNFESKTGFWLRICASAHCCTACRICIVMMAALQWVERPYQLAVISLWCPWYWWITWGFHVTA